MKTYTYSVTGYLEIEAVSADDAEAKVRTFLAGGPLGSFCLGQGAESTACASCGLDEGHDLDCTPDEEEVAP